jgi:hypothetical protein
VLVEFSSLASHSQNYSSLFCLFIIEKVGSQEQQKIFLTCQLPIPSQSSCNYLTRVTDSHQQLQSWYSCAQSPKPCRACVGGGMSEARSFPGQPTPMVSYLTEFAVAAVFVWEIGSSSALPQVSPTDKKKVVVVYCSRLCFRNPFQ